MEDKKQVADKSNWAIGGGVMLGLGVGLFFLKESPLAFIGSLIGGLGLGLIITAIISSASSGSRK